MAKEAWKDPNLGLPRRILFAPKTSAAIVASSHKPERLEQAKAALKGAADKPKPAKPGKKKPRAKSKRKARKNG